ncbi:hypothetical protein APSETT445_008277 [Aspergillus pseudonomiae]
MVLPNIVQASRGQFTKVFHFDHKSQIESWANEELPAITILHPEIFARGPEITASKTYPVVGPKISFSELATVFEATTSRPARFKPSTLHEWGATVSASAGAGFERDIRQMIEWITVAPDDKICYGTMNPDEDQSQSDLGVRASTFQEWLERSGWTGPDDGVK